MTTHRSMSARSARLVFLLLGVGCGGPSGGADAGSGDAGALDAHVIDAGTDAGAADAGSDATVLEPDAAVPDPREMLRTLVCQPLAHAMCSSAWDCECPDVGSRPDPAVCESTATTRCLDAMLATTSGMVLEMGLLTPDWEMLAACAARAAEIYSACDTPGVDILVMCRDALDDSADIGGMCASYGRTTCADGRGYCDFTCVSASGRGEGCDVDLGPFCERGLVCRTGVCSDPGADGDVCGVSADCGAGLVCVAGQCRVRRRRIGEACRATAECVAGATCGPTGCAAIGLRGACITSADCPSLTTCENAYDRFDASVCASGARPIGAPCTNTWGLECVAGAYCDFGGRCAARRVLGESCERRACASGLTCLTPSYVCGVPRGMGDPCFYSDECSAGLACHESVCDTAPGDGERCADDDACAAGLVCEGDPARCKRPRNVGESCVVATDEPCVAGTYCNSIGHVCVFRAGASAPCPLAGLDYGCLEGLRCDETLLCAAPLSEGDHCDGGDSCGGGLRCALPSDCVARLCMQWPKWENLEIFYGLRS